MASLIPCMLAVFLAIHSAQALVCYQCDSSKDTFCGYGLLSFTQSTKTCDDGSFLNKAIPYQCAKITAKSADGKEYVARDCALAVGSDICNALVKTAGIFSSIQSQENLQIDCKLCDGDKCNSATKFTGFSLLAVTIASIIFML